MIETPYQIATWLSALASLTLASAAFADPTSSALEARLTEQFGLGSTTPREMARLMELIATGAVASRQAGDEMIALLNHQQFRDMIPRLLPGELAGVAVANKTGMDAEKTPDRSGVNRHVRADAAIVTTPNGRYVISINARQVEDTRWSVDNDALVTGAEVSRTIYDHFTRR